MSANSLPQSRVNGRKTHRTAPSRRFRDAGYGPIDVLRAVRADVSALFSTPDFDRRAKWSPDAQDDQ